MLVLASASPRRHALLREAGILFRTAVPAVEEVIPERGDPHPVARQNAERKALSVPGEAVLGADTVVALAGRLLGKPADPEEAREMLRALSGTTHSVVTGVALLAGGRMLVRSVETRVTMRVWTRGEIAAYVASGEAAGKAGAYAIQESADRFVTRIDGPFDNVVGLPMDAVRDLLRKARIRW